MISYFLFIGGIAVYSTLESPISIICNAKPKIASVEQQARPALRGKPVGIVPFDGTVHKVVISCSKEAKARGVKTLSVWVML